MLKKVSLKDIAKEVGVSTALVSYVLNGKNTDRINIETAKKIKEVANKHHYTPNLIAKSLKNNKTFTLGLIVADISNLFYSELAQHIEEEASKYGYNVIFGSAYEDPLRFKKILEIFVSKQVDGLILAVPDKADQFISSVEENSNIPYVVIDREFESLSKDKIVNIDNFEASKIVVEHFHQHNFKRIAAVALKTDLIHLINRKKGYINTVNQLYKEEALFYDINESSLEKEIEDIIIFAIKEKSVDSFYFMTNRIAMAGLAVLAKNNIDVPEAVGVICFDQADAYNIFKTSISFVKQPLKEMSIAAVNKILFKDKGEMSRFNVELIVRNSTDSR